MTTGQGPTAAAAERGRCAAEARRAEDEQRQRRRERIRSCLEFASVTSRIAGCSGALGALRGRAMTVTVLSGPERRRRWTTTEKLRIVEESLGTGAVTRELARRYDIHPNQFHAWRRQARLGLQYNIAKLRHDNAIC